jgi:hypothetical protein
MDMEEKVKSILDKSDIKYEKINEKEDRVIIVTERGYYLGEEFSKSLLKENIVVIKHIMRRKKNRYHLAPIDNI